MLDSPAIQRVRMTSSSMNVETWTTSLTQTHLSLGRKVGPAITDIKSNIMDTSNLDLHLHEHLIRLFEEGKVLPPEIKAIEDVTQMFSVFRSLRRASDTRSINCKVSSNEIGLVNRWTRVE